MTAVLGDFNAKSQYWWKNDITSLKNSMVDNVMSNYGLYQLVQVLSLLNKTKQE